MDAPAEPVSQYDVSNVQLDRDAILANFTDLTSDTVIAASPEAIEITQYAHPDHAKFLPITFNAEDLPCPPDGEFAPRRRHSIPQIPRDTVRHLSNGQKDVRSEEQIMAELDKIDSLFKGMQHR
jgi:hypothetical protein